MQIRLKQIEKQNILKRLFPYSTPYINTFVGIVVLLINGAVFPVFGIFLTNMLFAMMNPDMAALRS
jgi:hypothetical protein